MTSVLFHFEVPESEPGDGSTGLDHRVRDDATHLQTSCRWWRSWCDPAREVLVLEGELQPDADVGVLATLHELAMGRLAADAGVGGGRARERTPQSP